MNTDQIIRSWDYAKGFQTANKKAESLAPTAYQTAPTLYTREHRRQKLDSTFDWESQNFEVEVSQAYGCVSSCYLEVKLPALGGGEHYKNMRGMFAIASVDLYSDSTKVYTVPYDIFIGEYLSSCDDLKCDQVMSDFLGGAGSGAARTVLLPLPLPNSHYLRREDNSGHSYGVFPNVLGNTSKLQFRITMNAANFMVGHGVTNPGSVANQCTLLTTVLKMREADQRRWSAGAGVYSVQVPTYFIERNWHNCSANVTQEFDILPTGLVTDLLIQLRPQSAASDMVSNANSIDLASVELICDSESIAKYDSTCEIALHKSQNGIVDNDFFKNEHRISFSTNANSSDKHFLGAMSFRAVSKATLRVTAAADCQARIVSKRCCKVWIQSNGKVRSAFE
jgi:hypothetical protein